MHRLADRIQFEHRLVIEIARQTVCTMPRSSAQSAPAARHNCHKIAAIVPFPFFTY